jgi:hypothetical protein
MATNWVNMIFGVLSRHLGSLLIPDPDEVFKLKNFVEAEISKESWDIPPNWEYV